MTGDSEIADVIIIGGSHAGLSAALTLYRACHTSLIFDAGAPRNAKADHVHMTPGFDKNTPDELREVARDELRATGLVRWKGLPLFVLFRLRRSSFSMAAVLANGPLADATMSTVYASDAKKFAETVKIYTHGNTDLAAAMSEKLPEGVEVNHRRLTRITEHGGGGIAVEFAEGPEDQLAFMARSPEMPVDRTLPDQLGCECDARTGIKVNPPLYSTTVPGVFAAGDCCAPLKSILMGMTAGSCAGVGIARELLARGA